MTFNDPKNGQLEIFNYPKGYEENLAWRRKLLLKARRDIEFRTLLKELFFKDVLFAFNAFFFTLDVRKRPWHHQPFCTYPYQDKAILEIVDAIRRGEDLVIEKSRDMGYSWMVVLVYLWFWLDPGGGADFLLGSRIEDYVDKKGDMRTLMEKARYALYRLPEWLRPKGFKVKVHDNFMRLQNPETGASITGESNNPNFSTGGRYLSVFFDEFAKWEGSDVKAWTSAGDATPCRLAGSTPFGAAGQYYDLVTNGKTRKIRLHWSLHPEKVEGAYCVWPRTKEQEELGLEESLIRSPWYDRECQRRSPTEVAQELDINYVGAGSPVFDGKAGVRVGLLLQRSRPVVRWYEPVLSDGSLREVATPRDGEGFVALWEEPRGNDCYTIGVDVVEGVEAGDFAVVKGVNRKTKNVALSYWSRIDEVQLVKVIVGCVKLLTTELGSPWVGIETTGPGLSTFDLCAENFPLEVSNLFMMPSFDQATQSVSLKKGWRTGTASRNLLISAVRDWLLVGEGWADGRLLKEMTTFVRSKSGKAEAKAGSHDDEVFAFGIALMVDDLVGMPVEKEKKVLLPLGADERVFDWKGLKTDELKTLEERCFASALAKQAERMAMERESFEVAEELTYY